VTVFADSELLVKQINGQYRVKNEGLKPLFLRALALLREFSAFEVRHVRRELNKAADLLANEAMDSRESVGDYACEPGAGDAPTLF
jgi:ribonuclease HI